MTALVETEIGTIASNWRVASLENVCETPQYGYTASAEEKGGVRFLRITDITDSGVNWSTVPYCECPPKLLDKYRLASGDIVFARIGATTGKSYLITNPPPSIFASYLIRVRAKCDIDPAFLSQFFRSAGYWRQVDAQKNANLKKGVNGSLLKTLLVPIPPFPEQQSIAKVLGVLLRAIEQQERSLQLTTELKRTLLHQLLTSGLRGEPQKQTEIGFVPTSWKVRRFEDFSTLQRGEDLTKNEFRAGTIPVAGSNGLIGYHNAANVHGPGVTVGRSGSVGKVLYHPTDFWAHNTSLYVKDFHGNDPLFAAYYLEHLRLDRFRSGTSVPTLDRNQFKDMLMAVPQVGEQQEIAHALRTLDHKIHFIEAKRGSLLDLFRTLLHQLMTAQTRVHHLDLSELPATV